MQTDSREFTIRQVERGALQSAIPRLTAECVQHEKQMGPGALILQMGAGEDGEPDRFWKPASAGMPDERFQGLADAADARRGILTVILIYPNISRVAGYTLNINTSPSFREITNMLAAVTAMVVVADGDEPVRSTQTQMRPGDIDQDEDFL